MNKFSCLKGKFTKGFTKKAVQHSALYLISGDKHSCILPTGKHSNFDFYQGVPNTEIPCFYSPTLLSWTRIDVSYNKDINHVVFSSFFFQKSLDGISAFCRATDTPVLNFWWCLPWISNVHLSNPGWIPRLRTMLMWCFLLLELIDGRNMNYNIHKLTTMFWVWKVILVYRNWD